MWCQSYFTSSRRPIGGLSRSPPLYSCMVKPCFLISKIKKEVVGGWVRGAAFIYVEHVGAVMHTDLCNLNKCWGMLWQPCMLLLICFYSLEIINIFYNSTKKKKKQYKKTEKSDCNNLPRNGKCGDEQVHENCD